MMKQARAREMQSSNRRARAPRFTALRLLSLCLVSLALSVGVAAQRGGGNGNNNPISSLKGVAVPQPADLARYVANQASLVTLGKALFWDVQVGSDGRTACATCHFHAGADHRIRNQIAGPATSTSPVRPNTLLTSADFPFHAFADPTNNASAVTRDRRDVVGSAGIVGRSFVDISDGGAADLGADTTAAGAFSLGGLKVRQVTSRNAPSVINAVFNLRNFWDGRANNIFNAATPFGAADARATVLVARDGTLAPEAVRLDASSLASQAVGPPVNAIEMSFGGRAWPHLGRKLLAVPPLTRQVVSASDSVLGSSDNDDGTGLRPGVTYDALIRASFQPAYWSSNAVVDSSGRVIVPEGQPSRPGEFTQMAFN